MGVLRFTSVKRGICVMTLLNGAKLGKALPVQVHCRGDENDDNNYACHNSNNDGNCVVLRILCGRFLN